MLYYLFEKGAYIRMKENNYQRIYIYICTGYDVINKNRSRVRG